jgi:predicted dehydrogenase
VRTLIVGLGDAGLGTHLPVLQRLRAVEDERVTALLAAELPLAYDVAEVQDAAARAHQLEQVESLQRATEIAYPGNTVVHVCTPVSERTAVIDDAAQRGYRLVVLDAPLAADAEGMRELLALIARYHLRVGVAAPWMSSGVTRRLLAAAADGRYGGVRRIAVRRQMPRLGRTFASPHRSTALDVGAPHGITLALTLGGNGDVVSAAVDNTPIVDGHWLPDMGSSTLTIQHRGGAVSEIVSDLAAPTWEQRVTVEFEKATVECHFPLGDDHYAHMYWQPSRGQQRRDIFPDDPMRQSFSEIYQSFAGQSWPEPSLRLHARVVEMLSEAKAMCRRNAIPAASSRPAVDPTPADSLLAVTGPQPVQQTTTRMLRAPLASVQTGPQPAYPGHPSQPVYTAPDHGLEFPPDQYAEHSAPRRPVPALPTRRVLHSVASPPR